MSDQNSMPSMKRSQNSRDSITRYAVQCAECLKWRLISTKEEYETIRENFIEDPYVCQKNSDVSCDDTADIEHDNTRIWVSDKPKIPKTPPNTERILIMRRDHSKMDTYYIMPNGKRVRSSVEVKKFLDEHPEYKDALSLSSFVFAPPKVMDGVAPKNPEKDSGGSNKKRRIP